MLKDIIDFNFTHKKIKINYPETIIYTENYAQYDQRKKGHGSQDQRFYFLNNKSGSITKSRSSIPKVKIDDDIILLSPEEVEKLQTVPKNYTSYAKKENRYEMLGNGWTVDVIAHIFSYIQTKKP